LDDPRSVETAMLNKSSALAMTAAPMKEALQEYGLDFAELARRAGLDPELLARPNARYPAAGLQRLWEISAAASGDPLFGFRVGNLIRPGLFHALGLGMVSSTSVLGSLERIERYSSVVSTNGRLAVVRRDGMVGLETRPNETTIMPTTECVDAIVIGLCRVLEQCAGPSAMPTKIVFMRPRVAPAEAYRAVLKCPVEFDGNHIAILFDAVAAERPVLTGNADLAAEADRLAARHIEGLMPESTATKVRALLLKAMPSGEFDQVVIARSLNQSASTLQRRLRKEGTTYQSLLDATRRELAFDYLRQGRDSLADIAFLLGFTDQANFTRAFRRWTGRTPREFLS
jgi:AraC-like DNA-binding protein